MRRSIEEALLLIIIALPDSCCYPTFQRIPGASFTTIMVRAWTQNTIIGIAPPTYLAAGAA